MKRFMVTKKKIFFVVSFLGSVLLIFFSNPVFWNLCDQLAYSCRENFMVLERVFWIFPIMLFFVMLTILLKRKTFARFWTFAIYATPITFLLLLALNLEIHHAPHGQWQDIFDQIFFVLVLGLFTLGSLIQIARGYWSKGA